MRTFSEVEITAAGYIGLALAILLLPLEWLAAAFFAALIHEACHVAVILLCGGRVERLQVGLVGAQIQVSGLNAARELLCALAGPIGEAMLIFLVGPFPRLAVCALVQSVYNLLPFYPLDGGRALRCMVAMVFTPQRAVLVIRLAEWIGIAVLLLVLFYLVAYFQLGIWPAAVMLALILRKIPCKASH